MSGLFFFSDPSQITLTHLMGVRTITWTLGRELISVIRAAIKKRKVFQTDDSVRKVIYLAIKDASKKWSLPIQSWRLAMSRFIIEFGDRLISHL
jgi:transposase-like protein